MSDTATVTVPTVHGGMRELRELLEQHNARALPGRQATLVALSAAYRRGTRCVADAPEATRHLYGLVRARSYLSLLDTPTTPHNHAAPDRDLLPPQHPFSTRAPLIIRSQPQPRPLVATVIRDSLGRLWNSLLHPRDRYGRFIPTFGPLRLFKRGDTGTLSNDHYATGRYMGANPDGSVNVRILASNDPDGQKDIGSIKTIPADQVQAMGGSKGMSDDKPGGVSTRSEKARIGDLPSSAGAETQEYRNTAARNAFNEGVRDLGDTRKSDLTANGNRYQVGDNLTADVAEGDDDTGTPKARIGKVLDLATTKDGRNTALVQFDDDDGNSEVSILDLDADDIRPSTGTEAATATRATLPEAREVVAQVDAAADNFTLDGGPPLPADVTEIAQARQIMGPGSSDSVAAKRKPSDFVKWVSRWASNPGSNRAAAPNRRHMPHVGDREIRTASGESAGVGSVVVFNAQTGAGAKSKLYVEGIVGVITNINDNANKGRGGARVIVWDPEAPNPDPAITEPGAWRFLSQTHLSGARMELVKEADPSLLNALGKGIDIGGGMTLMPQNKRIARTLTRDQIAAGGVTPIDQRYAVDMNGEELRKGDHVVGMSRSGALVYGHIQNVRPGETMVDVTPYGGGEPINISASNVRFMRKATGPYGTADRDDVFYEDAADFNMPVYDRESLAQALEYAGASDAEIDRIRNATSAEEISEAMVESTTRQRIAAVAANLDELDTDDPEKHSPEARTVRMLDTFFRGAIAGRLLESDGGPVPQRPDRDQTRAEGELDEFQTTFPQAFGDFYSDDSDGEYFFPSPLEARNASPDDAASNIRTTADQAAAISIDDPRQMTIEMATVGAWLKAENHPRGPQMEANGAISAAMTAIAKANQPDRTDGQRADLLARASDRLRAVGNRPGAAALKPALDAMADRVDAYADANGYGRDRTSAPQVPAPAPQVPALPENAPTAPDTGGDVDDIDITPPAPTAPVAPTAPAGVPGGPARPEPTLNPDGTITVTDEVAADLDYILDSMSDVDPGFTRDGNRLTITDSRAALESIGKQANLFAELTEARSVPEAERRRYGDRANALFAVEDLIRNNQDAFGTPSAPDSGDSLEDWEQELIDIADNPTPAIPSAPGGPTPYTQAVEIFDAGTDAESRAEWIDIKSEQLAPVIDAMHAWLDDDDDYSKTQDYLTDAAKEAGVSRPNAAVQQILDRHRGRPEAGSTDTPQAPEPTPAPFEVPPRIPGATVPSGEYKIGPHIVNINDGDEVYQLGRPGRGPANNALIRRADGSWASYRLDGDVGNAPVIHEAGSDSAKLQDRYAGDGLISPFEETDRFQPYVDPELEPMSAPTEGTKVPADGTYTVDGRPLDLPAGSQLFQSTDGGIGYARKPDGSWTVWAKNDPAGNQNEFPAGSMQAMLLDAQASNLAFDDHDVQLDAPAAPPEPAAPASEPTSTLTPGVVDGNRVSTAGGFDIAGKTVELPAGSEIYQGLGGGSIHIRRPDGSWMRYTAGSDLEPLVSEAGSRGAERQEDQLLDNILTPYDGPVYEPGHVPTQQPGVTPDPNAAAAFSDAGPDQGPSPSLPTSDADTAWQQAASDAAEGRGTEDAVPEDAEPVPPPEPNSAEGTPDPNDMITILQDPAHTPDDVQALMDTWFTQGGYAAMQEANWEAWKGHSLADESMTYTPEWFAAQSGADLAMRSWESRYGQQRMALDGLDIPDDDTVRALVTRYYSGYATDKKGIIDQLSFLVNKTSTTSANNDREARAQAAESLAQLVEKMAPPYMRDEWATWYREQAVRIRDDEEEAGFAARPRHELPEDPKFKSVKPGVEPGHPTGYWRTSDDSLIFDGYGITNVYRRATPAEVLAGEGINGGLVTVYGDKEYVKEGRVFGTSTSAANRRRAYKSIVDKPSFITPTRRRIESFDMSVFTSQSRFTPGAGNWQNVDDTQDYDEQRRLRGEQLLNGAISMVSVNGTPLSRDLVMRQSKEMLKGLGIDQYQVTHPTARVIRNGHVNIELGQDAVDLWGDRYDEHLAAVTAQIDKLMTGQNSQIWDRPIFVRISGDVFRTVGYGPHVGGYAYQGNHFLAVQPVTYDDGDMNGDNKRLVSSADHVLTAKGVGTWHAPSAVGNSALIYTITHEWGHMADNNDPFLRGLSQADLDKLISNGYTHEEAMQTSQAQGPTAVRAMLDDQGNVVWWKTDELFDMARKFIVSDYGSQKGVPEEYIVRPEMMAESFAEWMLTDGNTTNPIARFLNGTDQDRIDALREMFGPGRRSVALPAAAQKEMDRLVADGVDEDTARFRAFKYAMSVPEAGVLSYSPSYDFLVDAMSTKALLQRMYGLRQLDNMTPEEIMDYLTAISPSAAALYRKSRGLAATAGVSA